MASLRDAIVANAYWGVANEPAIHYSQGPSRMNAIGHPHQLPLYTDCSAFITLCYNWAGAPDPNGRHYDGYGFTGTFVAALPQIDVSHALPGDVIVYGPGTGDHIVVVVQSGSDPLTISHGQERGPALVRHSVEVRAHRAPSRAFRGIGIDNAYIPTNTLPPPPPPPPRRYRVNAITSENIFSLNDKGEVSARNIKAGSPWYGLGALPANVGKAISIDATTRVDGTIDVSVKTDTGAILVNGAPKDKGFQG